MKIIINRLWDYIGEENVFTYREVRNIIKNDLNIDIPDTGQKPDNSIVKPERELFVKKSDESSKVDFYFKWTYKIDFQINNSNTIETKHIEFIQHGFVPYYIKNYSEKHLEGIEQIDILKFVKTENYIRPKEFDDGFKKVQIRKRKLVCHYTKRETAIEKILTSKTLLFNEIQNSNDPWEYEKILEPVDDGKSEYIDTVVKKISFEEQKLKRMKFLSFSKDIKNIRCFDNVLMWAHYADKHRGVCLVFDEKKLWDLYKDKDQFPEEDRLKYKIVNYKHNTPPVQIKGNDDLLSIYQKNGADLFFIKKMAWKYESEYRLMLFNGKENKTDDFLRDIDKALVAIIIGIGFPEIYRCVIDEILKEYSPQPKLYQMKWDPDGFFTILDLQSRTTNYCSEVLNDYLIEI
jgi:hypothetical protein